MITPFLYLSFSIALALGLVSFGWVLGGALYHCYISATIGLQHAQKLDTVHTRSIIIFRINGGRVGYGVV